MQFIKKKNFTEREELQYIPVLHWMYVLKPVVIVLLAIGALYFTFSGVSSFLGFIFYELQIYFFISSAAILIYVLSCRIYLYYSIEYGVTNKRLLIKKGVFTIRTMEISINRIESIYCVQSLCGRIFNYGSIFVSGIGGTAKVFFMVCKPYTLRRKIAKIIEKNKIIHVVHGGLPDNTPPPPPPVTEDPYIWGDIVVIRNNEQKETV